MLLELRIGHLALVDELTVPLGPGLTVLTGETGAGKSLVAGALGLLSGGKADKDLVRQGEEEAYIEGVFDLSAESAQRQELARAGIRLASDHVLVLRRELRRQGRSRVLINGLVSSLTLLQTIGSRLLAIQSQDQQRELSDADFARDFLDGQLGLGEQVTDLRQKWEAYQACQETYAAREREEAMAQEQLSLWQYQHDELAQANFQAGEEEQLVDKLALKRHASSLQEGAARASHLLSEGDETVRDKLGQSTTALQHLVDKSRKLRMVLSSLQEAEAAVNDAASELIRFLDDLDLDAADLEEMETRKALYEELRRKYQRDTAGLLKYQQQLADRLDRQQTAADDLRAFGEDLVAAQESLEKAALKLHTNRRKGAPELAEITASHIRHLALPNLELEFRITLREDAASPLQVGERPCRITTHGCDDVELYVRTNPGERMGPVATFASGGERSRIHLGLNAMRQERASTPLLLFDEIDAGLGMDAAPPVAALLGKLAERGQVICITHLPTMAVHGINHLKVTKRVLADRTELQIATITAADRIDEIARLLGGEGWQGEDGTSQRAYAEELLRSGKLASRAQF
jgi:DNA repair protein RecN (Recombination protein N)